MSRDDQLREKVRAAIERREELGRQLADPSVIADPDKLRQIAQEHSGLEGIAGTGAALLKLDDELEQAVEISKTADDKELGELARAETEELGERIAALEVEARDLLIPKDPLDDRAAVAANRVISAHERTAVRAQEQLCLLPVPVTVHQLRVAGLRCLDAFLL